MKTNQKGNLSQGTYIKGSTILQYLLIIIGSAFLAKVFSYSLWVNYNGLIHTVLELSCTFIALSAFIVSWYTYENSSTIIRILGFGFLAVAILNAAHTIFFEPLKLYPINYFDLSPRLSMISRFFEAVILLISSYKINRYKLSKWTSFLITVILSLGILAVIYLFPNLFSQLFIDDVPTPTKVFFEILLIVLFVLSLYVLRENNNTNSFISYNYIVMALLLAIPTEICFTIYRSLISFWDIFGHILKISSYYFLYKGIFVSAVTYPYKNMVKALGQSESQFTEAFLHAAIGMALVGLDGKVLKVNKSICELLGYSEDELLKIAFRDITHIDDIDIDANNVQALINGDIRFYHMEKRYYTRNGSVIWVLISVSLVRDASGNPIQFVCQIQDITESKKADELRKTVEESTRLLKETMELDKLKTEFFANLSHEFKTPLNVILSALQLVELYLRSGAERNIQSILKNTKVMKQNCYRLLRLINNLIDTTKLDVGYFKINLQNCDIVRVVEEITMSVAEYVKSKGITLLFDTEIEEKVIACDPDKIERIILNLLSNAIKFTDEDGSIFVNMYFRDEKINISVQDTGIGIPEDKQDIIFERFRQVDKSINRNQEGSGIGLSLVKSLVEMHGGSISVRSKLGEGSEFIITLPDNVLSDEACCELDAYSQMQDNGVERINLEFSDIYILN